MLCCKAICGGGGGGGGEVLRVRGGEREKVVARLSGVVRGFKEVGKCAAPCFEIVRITISVGSS